MPEKKNARVVLLIGAVVLLGAAAVYLVARQPNQDALYPQLVEAGKWLRPFVDANTVVYSGNSVGPRNADAKHRKLPEGNYEEILDAIVAEQGDFLILDEAVLKTARPELIPLVTDKPVSWFEPRLNPVYIKQSPPGITMIYRVIREGGPSPLASEQTIRDELALLDHSRNHLFHAFLSMRKEMWSASAGEFARAIRADSTLTVAFNNRAWCLLQAGIGKDNAEADAREAVSREPGNRDYMDTLIGVLNWVGKDEEARVYQAKLDSLSAGG